MSMLSEVMHSGESSCKTSLNFSDGCDIVCLFATNLHRIYIYANLLRILRANNRHMTKYRQWFTAVNKAIVAQMAIQKKTQKILADELGIHPATINRKLKDPGLFTTGEFGQVCESLNIDLQNLQSYDTSAN